MRVYECSVCENVFQRIEVMSGICSKCSKYEIKTYNKDDDEDEKDNLISYKVCKKSFVKQKSLSKM